MADCSITAEFDGVSHKTSHDGLFKIKPRQIPQEILNEIGGIRVRLGGSFVTFGKKKEDEVMKMDEDCLNQPI